MTISLAAEPVFHIAGFPVTNSAFTALLLTVLMTVGALLIRLTLSKRPGKVQAAIEIAYETLYGITLKTIGNAAVASRLFPFIVVSFFYIVLSNWSGLLPGFGSIGFHHGEELVPLLRAPTSDLNAVIVLALISVCFVQYLAISTRGAGSYLKAFFNFDNPIAFFVGIIELISELLRPISYTFRLFGNIFAGEVLITVILSLTTTLAPYVPVIPLPFFLLEIFVGVIQAYVFCFLTIVFASVAVAVHDSGGHEATQQA